MLSDTRLLLVTEFQQHKKLSPARDEVVLHTRKGELNQTFEAVTLLLHLTKKHIPHSNCCCLLFFSLKAQVG